jgi:hypothetical protein
MRDPLRVPPGKRGPQAAAKGDALEAIADALFELARRRLRHKGDQAAAAAAGREEQDAPEGAGKK